MFQNSDNFTKMYFANISFVFLLRSLLKMERTFLPLLYFCVCSLKCTFNRENPQGRPGSPNYGPRSCFIRSQRQFVINKN